MAGRPTGTSPPQTDEFRHYVYIQQGPTTRAFVAATRRLLPWPPMPDHQEVLTLANGSYTLTDLEWLGHRFLFTAANGHI